MMLIWVTADVVSLGVVSVVEAQVSHGIASCRVDGKLRVLHRSGQWAASAEEAAVLVREKVQARLSRLGVERARLVAILAMLDRGELPLAGRGEA